MDICHNTLFYVSPESNSGKARPLPIEVHPYLEVGLCELDVTDLF